jgi:hypothetical protein
MGLTSLITVPEDPAFDIQEVTLEAWVNPRNVGERIGVLDHDGQYGLIILPGARVMCVGGGGTALSTTLVTAGTWVSLACTFGQGKVEVWFNGALSGSDALGTLATSKNTGLTIGSDGPDGNPLDGLIDNVRLWRTVRSAADLCAAAIKCP